MGIATLGVQPRLGRGSKLVCSVPTTQNHVSRAPEAFRDVMGFITKVAFSENFG